VANGKSTGRNLLPRISSTEGIESRMDRRLDAMPKGTKNDRGYRKPASRNRRKVGRG
jgi:hypothetical protein